MNVFRSEIRTGSLIVGSVLLLVIGMFVVSDLRHLWDESKNLTLLFPNADGIGKGAPVWYAGLEVGEVSDVRITHGEEDRIAVTVRIRSDARVRQNSQAFIRNLGMMGNKYIEISPGSGDSPLLTDGDILEGQTPVSIGQIIETGRDIALQLQGTVGMVQETVHEFRTSLPLSETLRNANDFIVELRERSRDLGRVITRADTFLATSQHSIDRLAGSLEATSREMQTVANRGGQELVVLLSEMRKTNRLLRQRLNTLGQQIAPVLEQAHRDLEQVGAFVEDAHTMLDVNDENIQMLLLHLKETSRHLEALSEDLRAHPWKIIWKADGETDGDRPDEAAHKMRETEKVGTSGQ